MVITRVFLAALSTRLERYAEALGSTAVVTHVRTLPRQGDQYPVHLRPLNLKCR